MASSLPSLSLVLLAGLAFCACSALQATEGLASTEPITVTTSHPLADLRYRFAPGVARSTANDPNLLRAPVQEILLKTSEAKHWQQRGDWLIPQMHERQPSPARPASVRLPLRASGAFEVIDDHSGMCVVVARPGAFESDAKQADGWLVYSQGVEHGDVLHRVTANGTEDFVYLREKPSREELRYSVDVSAVAGLRLVSNVLEFLDASGDPRLRMTAPALVDGAGELHPLQIEVEGCSFSEDPAPPWGKTVTTPGQSQCEVFVRWKPGRIYPLLIDPSWTTSGELITGRSEHTASLLLGGEVLVVGGRTYGGGPTTTSEVWKGGTFAVSGDMQDERSSHTASTLQDGRVLVTGGLSKFGNKTQKTAELWENGVFVPGGEMAAGRESHTSSVLPDGRVLVIGGQNGSKPLQTSELWVDGKFFNSGSMEDFRTNHTASLLPDGRVLVVGSGFYPTSEIWSDGVFSKSGSMSVIRSLHTASVLPDGRVLVVGGDPFGMNATAEVWQDGVFVPAGSMSVGRVRHTASVLSGGQVLITGGSNNESEDHVFVWSQGAFFSSVPMTHGRAFHTATVLPDGRVLIVGGYFDYKSYGTSEIWFAPDLKNVGKNCDTAESCVSGVCADGVCCASECDGVCRACSQALTGQPQGICAPVLSGIDPDNECAVVGVGACQSSGACDGAGKCATAQGIVCQATACSDDGEELLLASSCDALGKCPQQTPKPCSPFVCDPGAKSCKTSCSGNSDCASGFVCNDQGQCAVGEASCLSATTAKAPDGTLSECEPYVCLDGQCLSACAASGDCAESFQCEASVCVIAQGEGGNAGTGGNTGTGGSTAEGGAGAGGSEAPAGSAGAGAEAGTGMASAGKGPQGGAAGTGGQSGSGDPAVQGVNQEGGDCGCRAAGHPRMPERVEWVGLLAAVAGLRSRRRPVTAARNPSGPTEPSSRNARSVCHQT